MRTRLATLIGACMLGACASTAQPDTPALIVEPDASSRADLLSAVRAALEVENMTLADDALTRESTILIERPPSRLNDRELGRPEQFQLVRTATGCVLIHQRTGLRQALTKVKCRPA